MTGGGTVETASITAWTFMNEVPVPKDTTSN